MMPFERHRPQEICRSHLVLFLEQLAQAIDRVGTGAEPVCVAVETRPATVPLVCTA
jgi:hypothetical protein